MTLAISEEQKYLEKIAKLEAELLTTRELPHLYSFKWYSWAREFYESKQFINLLCAANQVSKSSTQIRKCINWATNKTLWPELWSHDPNQFWYLYPTSKQVNIEFETKWKLFLPRGSKKDDPIYGWHEERYHGDIVAIHFKSGVHVYFKTYAQNAASLQSGTCDAIFCDEELPVDLYDELIFRISASDGYFHMVFTATLGQDFWRRAMELESLSDDEVEALPEAKKWVVSLYECKEYEDGSASHWTEEKINKVRNRCGTHNEVLKRVYGRFILDKGKLKYPTFDIKKHIKEWHQVPKTWLIYEGVDIGSGDTGSSSGHPAAIAFVAVRPDFKQGRVFLGWRGDGVPTTAGDVFRKHRELKKTFNIQTTSQFYDWASADFNTIATSAGDSFEKAEKSHDVGEDIINTLFKNDMLAIYDSDELQKLSKELTSLRNSANKRHAKDDFIDALRYAVTKIPWDFSDLSGVLISDEREVDEINPEKLSPMQLQIAERRKAFENGDSEDREYLNQEIAEANESYGN